MLSPVCMTTITTFYLRRLAVALFIAWMKLLYAESVSTKVGRYITSICTKPTSSTQPCILLGSLHWVLAEVKVGMSPILGGRFQLHRSLYLKNRIFGHIGIKYIVSGERIECLLCLPTNSVKDVYIRWMYKICMCINKRSLITSILQTGRDSQKNS